jgi:hypothetical protein
MDQKRQNPPDDDLPRQPTNGFCGWGVFSPQTETWLGFALAWLCVAAIILLTALFARIGS